MTYDITSPVNERIKWLVRLRERRHRDAEGVFVVEGARLYDRAISAGLQPRLTFVSDSSMVPQGEVVTVAPGVLNKASYRTRSEEIIGVFEQFQVGLDEIETPRMVLITEDLEKPGNLGAIVRTAAVAGADAVVAVGDAVDPFNPNVLRASTGAVFSIPVAVSNWDTVEPWLATVELRVLAATPETPTTIYETDLCGPIAVVIGGEDIGLSKRARSVASELVSIPQAHTTTDSLNASVAAGIVLFEAVRQRDGWWEPVRDEGKSLPG